MSVLDQPEVYQRLDPSRLVDRIASLPDQCWQAWREGLAFEVPPQYSRVEAIVLAGMGGSAIGGDLLAGLAALEEAPPIVVSRDYSLPRWVGPTTLVLVSSYSGDTPETLSAYRQARQQGACMVAITSGGALAQEAMRERVALFQVSYRGEPRSALGYSFVAPLAFLCKLGHLSGKEKDVEESVALLRDLASAFAPSVPQAQNLAKTLAISLQGRLPVIYGAGFLGAVARRWKTQLNENSKVWAFHEELPEACHNAVQGYALPATLHQQASVLLLHSTLLDGRVSRQYDAVQDILEQAGIPHRRLDGVGRTPLAHLFTTLYLGDYASYYLAILNNADPSPVPAIEDVKQRLASPP
ncbi:MAG: bifunctional phosphoglucose/phosphomannose isomerase [Chloroflexi bacterium]|nr:bifunctional phosphoglucose/phosphomannose isomerase [Chloroflexota bacterium]